MRYQGILCIGALALTLTACGGGSSTSPASTATGGTTQSVAVTGQSANAAFPVTLSSSVAAAAGVTNASFTLPFTLPSTTQVAAQTGQPSSILTPFSVEREPLSFRSPESASIPNAKARVFFVVTPPANLSLTGNFSVSFSLQNTPDPSVNYYVAAFDGAKWEANATGSPATISGNTLTFSGTFPSGAAISANQPYAICLYTLPITVTSSVTTVVSGNPVTVGGLIDGSVSLTLPDSTTPVSVAYTTTLTPPSGFAGLNTLSGVNEVPGYVTITPSAPVTFPAGSQFILNHPITKDQPQSNGNGSTPGPTSGGGTTATGAPTGNGTGATGAPGSSGNNNNNGNPYLAFFNPTQSPPGWSTGYGTYFSDGTNEGIHYTLPINVTLQANTTYAFAVYIGTH